MPQQAPSRGNPIQDYVTVAERIEKFYARHENGRIVTHIVEHDAERGFILMRAEIYRNADDALPAATGHAYEFKSEGYVQRTSYIEVCECVPIDTEILTINGWKTYDELAVGDLVMSYDIGGDEMVWTPVQRKSFYSDQPIVRLYNPKGFEVFCTPNHTWAIEYKVAQKQECYLYRKLKATSELKKVHAIIGSAPMRQGFLETTPREAAVMGWAITDGWFTRRTSNQFLIGIGQSKPETVDIIRSLLNGITHSEHTYPAYTRTLPSGRTYDGLESVHWQLSAKASRELLAAFGVTHESELPRVVPQLSFEARAAMLEAMMLGDGTEIERFGCKNRPWVMDVFSMLCALQGHVALKRQFSSIGEVPLQTLKRTSRIWASSLQREDAGRTDVWCPTVEYGTWIARFSNGVTVLTGNTSCVGRALAMAGFEVRRGIASREEMEKATRAVRPEPPREKEKTAPAPPAKQPQQAANANQPATDDQKQDILDLLEMLQPGDRRSQRRVLVEMTGKESRDDLTQQEAASLVAKLKREVEEGSI